MSIETTEEFIKVYGSVKVTFSSYHKYTFEFKGKTKEGHLVSCSVGGHADEIYRLSVGTGEVSISELDPYAAVVTRHDGKGMVSFYDY